MPRSTTTRDRASCIHSPKRRPDPAVAALPMNGCLPCYGWRDVSAAYRPGRTSLMRTVQRSPRSGSRYPARVARDVKILEAAAKLFQERGFGAVGVDEIGERAGVTGPAIYRHFRGKEDILASLFDQALDGLLEATAPGSEVGE